MLTLQELKQVVGNREERRKVPSARYLRENDVAVVKQRLIDGAEIIAYQTGYVSIAWVIMERFFLYLPVEIMYMKQEEK